VQSLQEEKMEAYANTGGVYMPDQKLENILNLALDATEEERDKSLELNVGYNPIEREWDLIVKYTGSLDCVRALGAQVVEMQNEFAIVTIRESLVDAMSACQAVEYVEKPKRLFFEIENGKRVSCITSVQNPPESLSGEGVLVAIIDSGIDYENAVFRNPDGTTRIRALWDQTIKIDMVAYTNTCKYNNSKRNNEHYYQLFRHKCGCYHSQPENHLIDAVMKLIGAQDPIYFQLCVNFLHYHLWPYHSCSA